MLERITRAGGKAAYMSVLYDRDYSTGALSLDTLLADGAGVRAMRGAQSVVASPDGKHVYAMGVSVSASRATGTGWLSHLETVLLRRGSAPSSSYRDALVPTASRPTKRWRDDAIYFYARDLVTGKITGAGGVSGRDPRDDGSARSGAECRWQSCLRSRGRGVKAG
jgi:hypothetical protein